MTFSKFVIASAAIALTAAVFIDHCDAQQRGFGGMRGRLGGGQQQVSEMDLLQIKEVLQHLYDDFGLDEETRNKINEISKGLNEKLDEERQSVMQGFREMSQEERREAMEDMQKVNKESKSESFKQVKPLLDKNQLKRLGELKMQRMGNAALEDNLVQEMLGFTKDQMDKVAGKRKSFDEKRREFMDKIREQIPGGGDRESMRERMSEMRESTGEMRENMEKAVMELLTDEQKQKLEEMRGKDFKFPERRSRRNDV